MIALALVAGLTGPLAALDPWVGHCWVAEITPDTTDRHCFTAVYGGAHVRDAHDVVKNGKTVYSGETLYSVEGGKIVFTYWNSLGGVMRGGMTPGPELRFTMKAAKAGDPDSATVWRRTADGYETKTSGKIRRFRRDDR